MLALEMDAAVHKLLSSSVWSMQIAFRPHTSTNDMIRYQEVQRLRPGAEIGKCSGGHSYAWQQIKAQRLATYQMS